MNAQAQFAALRMQAGLSVDEVARRIGKEPGVVQAYERGDRDIPVGDLRALSVEALLAPVEPPPIQAQTQTDLFDQPPPGPPRRRLERRGAFTDNMKLPVHRWFRYSAGFSADWARSVIAADLKEDLLVLDPFAGSGTTLLAAQSVGARSIGFEQHPFILTVARAKLLWPSDPTLFENDAQAVLRNAMRTGPVEFPNAPELLAKCYTGEALGELTSLRRELERASMSDDSRQLVWLALTSILRECSHVGTAQWQYVLPNKSKARVLSPFKAFAQRVSLLASDMRLMQRSDQVDGALMLEADARHPGPPDLRDQIDLVVTSPPYPNNYDYADATRLEMSFWGEISSWGELHAAVRNRLICSCSQHSAAERMVLDELLADPLLDPIRAEITKVCRQLEEVREEKGGRKTYHTMIAAYFVDLAKVWGMLRPLMRAGSQAYFVIGDSAPYGVYVPCDKWLGELALAAGFHSFSFEKLRDRNTKWKNRKHSVPLHEGILRVSG